MRSSHIYSFVHLSNQGQVKFDFVQIIAQYCHTSSPIPFFNNNFKKTFFVATQEVTPKKEVMGPPNFYSGPCRPV